MILREVIMNVEKRKKTDGSIYFSFTRWDGKKKIRLKKSEHPYFDNYESALEWANAKSAEEDTMRIRAMKRLEWQTRFYNFKKISKDYIDSCKRTQPNSWKGTQYYLFNYVLPYFLNKMGQENVNNWYINYENYKNWLEDEATTITHPKRPISYSSMNHCIKTLNTFSSYLVRNGLLDPGNMYKVTSFGVDKLNERDADDLINLDEFQFIYKRLQELSSKVAIFYQTAYFTGMRFNEIFGLSMNNLYLGKVEDSTFCKALEDHGIDCFGYIVLESQPAHKTRKREEDGSIKRKPLKSKKKIEEKNNRIIPIIDKELFNNLAMLYKEQEKLHQKRTFGPDRNDYLLFDEMSTSLPNRALKKVYEKTNYKHKSFHCCRHSRCTELVGTTRDIVLTRMWLGHTRQEVTDRYIHIYQRSVREAKRKVQKIDFIE